MKTILLAASMLFCCSSASSQQVQTIKGHALGESLADFQNKTPGAKLSDYDQNGNTLKVRNPNRTVYEFPTGSKAPLPEAVAVFEDGKLIFLKIPLNMNVAYRDDAMLFPEAEIQLAQKFGKPTDHQDLVSQNGFGAIFHEYVDTWDKPESFMQLFGFNNQETGLIFWMTASEHQRELNARPKPSL